MPPEWDPLAALELGRPLFGPLVDLLRPFLFPLDLIYATLVMAAGFGTMGQALGQAVGGLALVLTVVALVAVVLAAAVVVVFLLLLLTLLLGLLRVVARPSTTHEVG
jgi:hypothetical protein